MFIAGIPYHQLRILPANRLIISLHKNLHHCWSFMKGIHLSSMHSPHKRAVMRKTFPGHDVIIVDNARRDPIET